MPGTGEKSRGHRISKKAWVLPSWVLASSAGDRFENKLHQHTKVHVRGLYQQSSDSEFKLPLQGTSLIPGGELRSHRTSGVAKTKISSLGDSEGARCFTGI